MERFRNEIIDLSTGKTYINESSAEKDTGFSRYLIHKSLSINKICKGAIFAYYSYGMDVELVKNLYTVDERKRRTICQKKD